MANLITEKQKKIIRKEYFIRFFSVSLLIISLLGVFLLAYVIPYYISVSKKDLRVIEQFTSVIIAENKENVGESMNHIVSQTTDQLKAIENYTGKANAPSEHIIRVLESKNSYIKINKFAFSIIAKGQGQLFVSGISENREGLVSFIEDLKLKGGFAGVESPVSDFAKDSDIPFTLKIKINI